MPFRNRLQAPDEHAPHVVIIGGGFGGLYAARELAKQPVRVTVLDRHNYHLFQPLLYQVATAALSPGEIAVPIRAILRKHRNVQVLLGEAESIDLAGRQVRLRDGAALGYDYLVLATGARHSYFGNDAWEAAAPGLKTLDDALEIRRRILLAFERAERTADPARARELLTFVVIGGGPTGVELAGAIAEIARHTVARDFRSIDPRQARVLLLEGGPRVLPAFPAHLSAQAERSLRRMGVEVRTGAKVTAVEPAAVRLGEEVIPAGVTLWAAGVAASPLAKSLGVPLDRVGRVPVAPDLTVPGQPNVYVVGDLAAFSHQTGTPLPGVAQVAIQQGKAAAANIRRAIRGEATVPFRYRDPGSLATIGRASGIAQFGPVQLWGLPAWLAWAFVHIFYLIGFANRALVMLQWAWSYFTFHRGARLITQHGGPTRPGPAPGEASPPS